MLDARVWLFWTIVVLVTASSTGNPLYLLLLFLITLVVGLFRAPASGRRVPLSPLHFAAIAIPLAAVFNGLTVHLGQTVLFRIPEGVPLLGGPVTVEGILFGAISGLLLTGIFTAFAVFNSVTPVHDLVRLTPRALREAGIILSIALTFIPQTTRSLNRIREAQAVRGHRVRGLRDWLPIFIPLLVSGLERSMGLAEAMVARGYVTISERPHSLPVRGSLALGLLALLGGLLGWLYLPARNPIPLAGMVLGGGLIGGAMWWIGRSVRRTTYRSHRWTWGDVLVLLGSGLTLAMGTGMLPIADRSTLAYSPFPRLTLPPFDPLMGIGLLGLLLPLLAAPRGEPGQAER